jgi:farnesyl diphosphate synthase
MDDDDLRRGKLSVHKKFNEFTAILAGNSLLTLAFEILSSKNLKLHSKIKNELIKSLANCSGSSGLAEGQYFDLTFENKKISKKKIIDIQYNKTGKLFAFCCECAGIIKEHNIKKRKILNSIGLNIGLLFQIADDLIDYKGDSRIVGKPTKRDKKKGKPTLVNLLGYTETLSFANNLKNKISEKIKNYGNRSQDLLQSVEFILDENLK